MQECKKIAPQFLVVLFVISSESGASLMKNFP